MVSSVYSQPVAVDGKPQHPKVENFMMKRFGGMVRQPNTEKGAVYFINKQTVVKPSVLEKLVSEYFSNFNIVVKVADSDVIPKKGSIVIRLEDLERAEPLIVAPENFWASVNVKALMVDNPPRITLVDRFRKEVKRAFAFISGGLCGNQPRGLPGVVCEMADLDAIVSGDYSGDVELRILDNLPALGVNPYRVCRYCDAVSEGWAPAPTNEYQKAIWDKIHTIPSKPMKIEFDPAAQKGKVTK